MRRETSADHLDPRAVRRGFDRAAALYDEAAVLQAQVRVELLARLDLTTLKPEVILDVGAGTGHASRALRKRHPKALVASLDASPAMLSEARRQQGWFKPFARLCAHAERLPLKEARVDLIVSNLALPWCDPEAAFAEFARVLKPAGLLAFTTFGPDTLRELRSCWAAVDEGVHVHPFFDMHDLGDALVRAGFADPVLDVEHYTLYYESFASLAKDLRATGSRNAASDRARGLTSPRRLRMVEERYEALRREGRLPASCEVVFAHAWSAPARSRTGPANSVSLDELRSALKRRRTL